MQNASGTIAPSDDALGQRLQLIGIGVDPLATLSAAQRDTWRALGGESLIIQVPGAVSTNANAWVDVDRTFATDKNSRGWIVAVRPDKVVLADGAPKEAGAIVDSVAKLLR